MVFDLVQCLLGLFCNLEVHWEDLVVPHIPREHHRSIVLATVRMYPAHLVIDQNRNQIDLPKKFYNLTSMPMAARFKVFLLSNAPAKAMSVPKDVSILGYVFEDRPLRCPLDSFCRHLISAITIGIGSSQNVECVTDDIRYSIFISFEVD